MALYFVVFGLMAAAYLLLRAIVASRFGRVLRGISDNPVRMEAIGFAPYRYQLTAYVIAGMIAGVAGCLLANQAEFVSPAYATWQRSGDLIFMIVLGGLGTLHGAIIGAAMFGLLAEFLSGFTEHWAMIFGPILILIVLFARGGIAGLFGRRHDRAPLHCKNLIKSYGALTVTDDVSLDIAAGELHAIIGPNGAGKTTLIHQVSGLASRIPAASSSTARTSPPCRCTNAPGSAWCARSRSPRSCRASRRWRMSRSRSRRTPARASGSSAMPRRKPPLNEPAWRCLTASALPPARQCRRACCRTAKNGSSSSPLRSPHSRSCCCSTNRSPAPATRNRPDHRHPAPLRRDLPIVLIEHDMDAVFALADRISVLVYGRIIVSGRRKPCATIPRCAPPISATRTA